ncbi:hypothetical protein ACFFU8_08865 [Chromobacterium piscinae]|uniref:hypothetical protein n=1 Tax=Chromobacterium piscinae TaxID=686831 RepID=UPI001E640487|nr:hypothetical protein [Chromobacterium piscinae]MCD5327985.1 hypothetical protein [Chromobacterium piscinae]
MHPLIENYPDYDAVLIRTDSGMAKDERFIIRAFTTFGFEDVSTGDDLEFRHTEIGVTMSCDGDSIAIYKNDDPQTIVRTYSDLFMILRNLDWTAAKLYCTGDASERLHELAGFIPASYDTLELDLGVEASPLPEVKELRETIQVHQATVEPTLSLAELAAAAQAPVDSLFVPPLPPSDIPNSSAELFVPADREVANVPVVSSPAASKEVVELNKSSFSPPTPTAPAAEPHPLVPPSPPVSASAPVAILESLAASLIQVVANQTQQSDRLLDLLNLMLMEKTMNHFAAALPTDALFVAFVEKPNLSALAKLGFTQDFKVWSHEEFGIKVDAGFLVITKDVADPVWFNEFLTKIGGKVRRMWKAEESLVGMVVEERMSPASALPSEVAKPVSSTSTQAPQSELEPVFPSPQFEPALSIETSISQVPASDQSAAEENLQLHYPPALDIPADTVVEGAEPAAAHAGPDEPIHYQAPADQLSPGQRMVAEQMLSSMTMMLAEVFKLQDTRAIIEAQMQRLEASVNGQIHTAPGFLGTPPHGLNGHATHHTDSAPALAS